MNHIESLSVAPAPEFQRRAQQKLDRKTKPPGSLGHLEEVAARLAAIQQTLEPTVAKKRVCIFAASHGVCGEGVSAYPAAVTGQMVLNFLNGGAAINVLARHGGIEVHVIDVGVEDAATTTLGEEHGYFVRKLRPGTRNWRREPAMTPQECNAALDAGREQVQFALRAGIQLLGIGEMGIGNTSSASALYVALLGFAPDAAVGRGTGIDDATLQRKVAVVAEAIDRYRPDAALAVEPARFWLETVGGYEIAAMVGVILEASRQSLAIVVDGFIATAAAAVAFALEPGSRRVCYFSHRSDECAHGAALTALGVRPLLDLQMRLGEGTGAALAMHIIEAAAKVIVEMATFESAGVSENAPAVLS